MIDSSALVMSPCMSNVYSHDRQPLRQRFKLPYVNVQLIGSGAIGIHHCVSVLYPLANVFVIVVACFVNVLVLPTQSQQPADCASEARTE